VADSENTLSENHTSTINRVSDSLNMLLGGGYSPVTLADESNKKAQHERLYARIAATEARRQRNLEAVISAAYDADDPYQEVQIDAVIDPDWLAAFTSHAQDIGNADMHGVWGHVLLREAAKPGTVSLLALQILSGMVPDDLDLWEKVGRIAFPTGYLIKIGDRNDFGPYGISKIDIAHLQTLGLLQDIEDLGITFYAPTKGITFDFKGSSLIVRHPTSQLFTLPAFRMTGLGVELLSLLADIPVNIEYLTALGKHLQSEDYDYRIRDAQGALIEQA